ncbi:energy transducer TonB [Sphingomonas sp. 4RDLI-65]|uniref:energy transducer TonB n=1 Tax=Sphingomonas sp. 4RDLI-65 TaxID=3111641 RepID=UPI003C28FAC6
MPAQSLAKPSPAIFGEARPAPKRTDGYPRAVAFERTVYQTRRISPGSAIAALVLAAAAFSSFQYLGDFSPNRPQQRALTIVTLADLATPAPPPAPEKRPVKAADTVPVHAAAVAPPPIVVTPAPPPALALAEAPAPPSPSPAAAKAATVQAVDTPAATVSTTTSAAGDLSSKMISATPPTYPVESRRLREQGTVVLAVLLSIEGRVERISIARTSGHPRLDRAASGAVRHWRWSPTVRDGQPVLVQGNVVIPFVLRS